jgi:hypothetical protein
LQSSFISGQLSSRSEAVVKASSQLITFYPCENRQPRIAPVSKHIALHLFDVLLADDARQFWKSFNLFWNVPQSRNTAGWLWEAHVLKSIFSDPKKRTIPFKPLPTSSASSISASVSLPFSDVRTYGNVHDLARQLAEVIPSLLPGHHVLFVPGASNQATFDAFSLSTAGIEPYQVTAAENNHGLKAKGLDFLWDALFEAQKLMGEEHHDTCQRLFPSKKARWQIVFVVPRRVQDSFVKLQKIEFGGAKAKRKWEDYLLQYVMVLPDSLEADIIVGQVVESSGTKQDEGSGGKRPRKTRATSGAEVHLGKRRKGPREGEGEATAPEAHKARTQPTRRCKEQ